MPISLLAQTKTVSGKVTDEQKMPLPGVSVVVKGTSRGVATDFDGNYIIDKVKEGDVLEFTSIGFSTLTKKVTGAGKSLIISVVLKEEAQQLADVVVVGFGKQKKQNLTGSVAVVDSKALESRPVTNAIQALQGQVAGMNFKVGAGGTELGGSPSYDIRGTGTIGKGSSASPLVLIDGVEGDLSMLNPQDIQSISVLKDAASASIYGSRAAFGVILVTTKSGKEGKVTLNYTQSFVMKRPTVIPQIMDSESFAYYFTDAQSNDGENKFRFNDALIQKIIDFKNGKLKDGGTSWNTAKGEWRTNDAWANTDWYKVMYRDWAPSQEHNLMVRGGTEKVSYYLSGNLLQTEGLLRYNTDTYDRYTLNGKFTAQLAKWAKATYNTRFTRTETGNSAFIKADPGLLYDDIARKWPIIPAFDPNGHFMVTNNNTDLAKLDIGRQNDRKTVITQQLNFVFSPIENWNTYVEFSYKTDNRNNTRYFNPIYSYDPDGNPIAQNPKFKDADLGDVKKPGMSGIVEQTLHTDYWATNIYTEYSRNIAKHFLKGMVGFQAENSLYKGVKVGRDGLLSESVIAVNTAAGKTTRAWGDASSWATAGFFGRLNYAYDDKYLLEFNLRYDGTSRFLRDQRWNLYPSASLGYNLAREKFWENHLSKINTFKFRASYGELGNQSTNSPYPFFQTMPFKVDGGRWLIDGIPQTVSSAPALVSPLLTWEKVATTNFGLDISAFENRLDFSVDVFLRKTRDMVGPAPTLPGILGIAVPRINNTDMESKGFELSLTWKDRIGKDFNYSVTGTLTDSQQKITRYPNEAYTIADYYNGRILGEIWGLTTHGMARSDQQMTDWLANHNQDRIGRNWGAGDMMYEDLNGDGVVDFGAQTVSNPGDLSIIGNSTPRYNFGLDINLKYKAFDFRVFFQGTAKRDLYLGSSNMFSGINSTSQYQISAFTQHLDYFRPEGTTNPLGANVNAYYPAPSLKYGRGKNFETPHTYFLQNGAFVRLKNIQIGYNIPKEILKQIGATALRVYISAENVYTWTKLASMFDPEAVSGYSSRGKTGTSGKMYPMSQSFSTGLSLTF